MIGTTLGHYRIVEQIGAGGMGEVYRGEDTRLGREVAIKVLPEAVAQDTERLARFEREAKVLASLNHPNIATLYGLETVSDTEAGTDPSPRPQASSPATFLVMELVEGEDLAQRIARGPIPVKESVAIGKQIADGLEAAHAKGIIHRDLKPANIRISTDGTVKILDFGLAKAWETPTGDVDPAESPTITAEMTRVGTILGTAPYLSPEQARGQVVDRRADIWAFGCVLHEMLTGRRVFTGDTSTEILAQILERDPDWSALPSDLSPSLDRLLRRCLEKDPKQRLRDAGDVALALEDLDLEQPPITVGDDRPGSSLAVKVLPWLVTAAAAILAIVAWNGRPPSEKSEASPTLRFTEASPAPLDIVRIGHAGSAVAISPNGQLLVWVGTTSESTQLYMRHLDENEAHPISGTEGGLAPFFSPDGEWIGFWADERLKKVAVSGGVPQTIGKNAHVHGASWGDGIIIMGAVGDLSLWWVDPAGGQAQRVESLVGRVIQGEYPRLLPGSRSALVSQIGRNTVDLVSLDSGEVSNLVSEGTNASYLPTGHLVWTQGDNLLAAPFDLSSGTITGQARTVIEGVLTERFHGALSHYAVSDEGTLAYLPGTFSQAGSRPTWVRLDGTMEPLPLPADSYLSPRVSPDGRRLLLSRQTKTRSLWLADLSTAAAHRRNSRPSRFTSRPRKSRGTAAPCSSHRRLGPTRILTSTCSASTTGRPPYPYRCSQPAPRRSTRRSPPTNAGWPMSPTSAAVSRSTCSPSLISAPPSASLRTAAWSPSGRRRAIGSTTALKTAAGSSRSMSSAATHSALDQKSCCSRAASNGESSGDPSGTSTPTATGS